jgi:hypothetical protein
MDRGDNASESSEEGGSYGRNSYYLDLSGWGGWDKSRHAPFFVPLIIGESSVGCNCLVASREVAGCNESSATIPGPVPTTVFDHVLNTVMHALHDLL